MEKIVQDNLDEFQQQTGLELTGYQTEEENHTKLPTECFLTLNHLQSISTGSPGSHHGIPSGSLEPAVTTLEAQQWFGAKPCYGIN